MAHEESKLKVVFISPEFNIYCSGLRVLSSVVKNHGYRSVMVFMPIIGDEYPEKVMRNLIDICKGSLAICITAMAINSKKAELIAKSLRRLNIPIIIGGIHATLNPEKCLEYVDFVSIGESEYALVELLDSIKRKEKRFRIKNICYKEDGKIVKNEVRELIQDINSLPLPDYDKSNKFICYDGEIVPFEEKHLRCGEYNISNVFFIFFNSVMSYHTTRGCPYECKYCCNYDLKRIYNSKGKYVRFLSTETIIRGLESVVKLYPSIELIWFTDDDFFMKSLESIKQFSIEYKRKINLPFMCYANPRTIDEEKLKHLLNAGLKRVEVGIQTGSERTNKQMYSRSISTDDIMKAARILNKYKDEMFPPEYQFINTNPLESEEDTIKTINLIINLPKPFRLKVFNMIFFPGSEFEKEYALGKEYNPGDDFSGRDYIDKFNHLRKGIRNKYYPVILSLMDGYCADRKYGSIRKRYLDILLSKKVAQLNKKIPVFSFFLMYIALNWKDPYWVLPSTKLKRISLKRTINRERKKRKMVDPKGFIPVKF
ncbi:MAG: radical SAM protein [Nanoarchaeota archaeon]|nr:radical SAM protein [Nanoarchaeota archaeon]